MSSKTVSEMRAILNTYSVGELKQFIKESNIEKFSLLTKPELIDLMVKPKHKGNFMNIEAKEGLKPKGRPKKGEVRTKAKPKTMTSDERDVLNLIKKFNSDFGEEARKGFKLNTENQIKKIKLKFDNDLDEWDEKKADLDDEDAFDARAKEHIDKAREHEKQVKNILKQAKSKLKNKK